MQDPASMEKLSNIQDSFRALLNLIENGGLEEKLQHASVKLDQSQIINDKKTQDKRKAR